MKRYLVTLLIVGAGSVLLAQDSTATLKRAAQRCAAALVAGNFDGVVTSTHKRVVAIEGGKDAMIAMMKRSTESMLKDGFLFLDATIGNPAPPKKVGSWLTSLVPEHIVIKVPGGTLQQESTLLGISEDDGKTWVFVDVGAVTQEQFEKIFPELQGKITLPARPKPVFTKE